MIIQVNGIDIKTYVENPWIMLQARCRCSFCEGSLVRNGRYDRMALFLQQVFHIDDDPVPGGRNR